MGVSKTYWIETLGCPKNQVDSDKLTGKLIADGMSAADGPSDADLVVVNTCAFIGDARAESVDTVLELSEHKRDGARVVVTGCMAERYGEELAEALPEVDAVVGFGVELTEAPNGTESRAASGRTLIPVTSSPLPDFDLLNLPRPASTAPWSYVKIAEGCDRACGFCAIPSFRGPQRSRSHEEIVAEAKALGVREVVLVAQDLAAFGRDQGVGKRTITSLIREVNEVADWVRLLYLYPSDLTDELVDAICETGVPYFDLSLQHVSRPLLRSMKRWGDGERFAKRIEQIRTLEPTAAFRSNFIVGYPGETEEDHDALLDFVASAQVDWCGFFSYSREDGTYAATLDDQIDSGLISERLEELTELQDGITATRRDDLIGAETTVLVDSPGVARSHREAPEIDGIVAVPESLAVGEFHSVRIDQAEGPDLVASPVGR